MSLKERFLSKAEQGTLSRMREKGELPKNLPRKEVVQRVKSQRVIDELEWNSHQGS